MSATRHFVVYSRGGGGGGDATSVEVAAVSDEQPRAVLLDSARLRLVSGGALQVERLDDAPVLVRDGTDGTQTALAQPGDVAVLLRTATHQLRVGDGAWLDVVPAHLVGTPAAVYKPPPAPESNGSPAVRRRRLVAGAGAGGSGGGGVSRSSTTAASTSAAAAVSLSTPLGGGKRTAAAAAGDGGASAARPSPPKRPAAAAAAPSVSAPLKRDSIEAEADEEYGGVYAYEVAAAAAASEAAAAEAAAAAAAAASSSAAASPSSSSAAAPPPPPPQPPPPEYLPALTGRIYRPPQAHPSMPPADLAALLALGDAAALCGEDPAHVRPLACPFTRAQILSADGMVRLLRENPWLRVTVPPEATPPPRASAASSSSSSSSAASASPPSLSADVSPTVLAADAAAYQAAARAPTCPLGIEVFFLPPSSSSAPSAAATAARPDVAASRGVVNVFGLATGVNRNAHLTSQLAPLLDAHALDEHADRDTVSGQNKQLQRALGSLCHLAFRVTDARQVRGLPGVGDATLDKIAEVLATGRLARTAHFLEQSRVQSLLALRSVLYIGPSHARTLYSKGARTIDDLRGPGALRDGLTPNQRLCVDLHDQLQRRASRSECAQVEAWMKAVVAEVLPGTYCAMTGSFRRGQGDSSDFDFVFSPPHGVSVAELSPRLYLRLKEARFLTATLQCSWSNGTPDYHMWQGICQWPLDGSAPPVPRRSDLNFFWRGPAPGGGAGRGRAAASNGSGGDTDRPSSLPTGLLSWTGNTLLNRSMREYANHLGFK